MTINIISPQTLSGLLIAEPVQTVGGSSDSTSSFTTVDGSTVDALLEIRGVDGGFLMPRLTTAQKNALYVCPGFQVFDTDEDAVSIYFEEDGWQNLSVGNDGGAPADGPYLTFDENVDLTNYFNVGTLGNGLLKTSASGTTATLALAVPTVDYYAPGAANGAFYSTNATIIKGNADNPFVFLDLSADGIPSTLAFVSPSTYFCAIKYTGDVEYTLTLPPIIDFNTSEPNTYAPFYTDISGNMSIESRGLIYREITITSAQIMTLDTVPISIIEAPGAGFMTVIESSLLYFVPGNVAYTSDPDYAMVYGLRIINTNNATTVSGALGMETTGGGGRGSIVTGEMESSLLAANSNQPIYFAATGPNTTGNGTIKIKVFYSIWSVT